jgi:hypothetical protein
MGINQSCPVLPFSPAVKKQVCWSHLRVSILQTRGVRNPPDKCGTRVARLPPKAAKLCAGHAQQLGGASPPPNLMEVKS